MALACKECGHSPLVNGEKRCPKCGVSDPVPTAVSEFAILCLAIVVGITVGVPMYFVVARFF
jgi:hypothetical protein